MERRDRAAGTGIDEFFRERGAAERDPELRNVALRLAGEQVAADRPPPPPRRGMFRLSR